MPIYTVEKDGFRAMVEALNPRYQLPHKDFFSRTAIPELYERTREQIGAKIKKGITVLFSYNRPMVVMYF